MTAAGPCLRPFKIWSSDRSKKHTIVAGSLRELIERGKLCLGVGDDDVIVVLEEDGTEVDEEDYFKMLPTNTVFLLLKKGEKWKPLLQMQSDKWNLASDGAVGSSGVSQNPLDGLVQGLKRDTGRIFLLTEPELQLLADMVPEDHAVDEDELKFLNIIQEACDRYLIDHAEPNDKLRFVRMCKNIPEKKV